MGISLGQRTFDCGLKTNVSNADAVESAIASHADFMKNHHSLDDSKIHLEHYYVSKADEMNDPTDPSKGTTGNVVYSINEVYVHAEGIGQHMEAAMAWDGIGPFMELLGTYGEVIIGNGEVIHTL